MRSILLAVLVAEQAPQQLGRGLTPIRFFRGFGSVPSDPRLSQNIGMLGIWNLVKIRKIEKLPRNRSIKQIPPSSQHGAGFGGKPGGQGDNVRTIHRPPTAVDKTAERGWTPLRQVTPLTSLIQRNVCFGKHASY